MKIRHLKRRISIYGKTLGQLERGMFNNIELVGNIINKSDRVKYLIDGRL